MQELEPLSLPEFLSLHYIIILVLFIYIFIYLFIKSQPPYQVEKKKKEMGVPEVGVSEEGVCCKIVFL